MVVLSTASSVLWAAPTPASRSPPFRSALLSGSSPQPPPGVALQVLTLWRMGLSCSHDGCPTIPRPLRRRVLRGCTPSSSPLPWPSPQQARLGSRLVPCGWLLTTRQASLHAADWWVAPSNRGLDPALRPRDLSRRRRAATKAAWPLLRPDSHRLVIVSLAGRTLLKNPSCTLTRPGSGPSANRLVAMFR